MFSRHKRIVTTHFGSLPRSDSLLGMLGDMEAGKAVDRKAFRSQARVEIAAVVRQQAASGVDIAGDGEIPRLGFSIYAKNRMTGFGGRTVRGTVTDFAKFPAFADFMARRAGVDSITKSATTWEMCSRLSLENSS